MLQAWEKEYIETSCPPLPMAILALHLCPPKPALCHCIARLCSTLSVVASEGGASSLLEHTPSCEYP